MGKRWIAFSKNKKRNSGGFTLIELLTAIGILGILAAVVVYMMATSSKTYNRLSVEAQLQSEAQLVANAISEIAIDSYSAKDSFSEAIDAKYDSTAKKLLVLNSIDNGVEKQYLVVLNKSEKELVLGERTYDSATSSWSAVTYALLGNNVNDFSVDISRVESENILGFDLEYNKAKKKYNGNYQVLMRNKMYAGKPTVSDSSTPSANIVLKVTPKIVYMDVVDNKVTGYYVDTVDPANKRTVVNGGIEFTSEVITVGATTDNKVNWKMTGYDNKLFVGPGSDQADKFTLKWNEGLSYKFKDSSVDNFQLEISKSIASASGTVDAVPKKAYVFLRRIKSVKLNALSGATQWKKEYETVYGGKESSQAQGYAYVGSNGKYNPMTLNASILSSNIAYGGGLTWKLYVSNSAGGWDECTNTSLAALQTDTTTTSTTNTVSFGTAVANGQLFKVVATSVFDPTYSGEYIFGIAPSSSGDGDGFYSRGYYTDMGALLKGTHREGQDDQIPVGELVFLVVTKVDGADNVGLSTDKIKVVRDSEGRWRLYIDYDSFAYSGDQRNQFYGGGVKIHITIAYYDNYGNLCMDGQEAWKYEDIVEAQEGKEVFHDKNEDGKNAISGDLIYTPLPVTTTKISPTGDVIVVEKGKSKSVSVKTAYYNIISPRKGTYYFGTYLDDMHNNLLESGKGSTHAYFEVGMSSSYGDTNKYVDTATVQLTAKSTSAQKKYLTNPVTMRLTANDYYSISQTSPSTNSYTDYKVLIANIEGKGVYIAGPEASGALSWTASEKAAIESGSTVEVSGLDTDGNTVKAKINKAGNKYYCKYGGKTYTYRPTYNVWAD